MRDDIKLFDFGLSREIRDEHRLSADKNLYNLTGDTGSPRYMPPGEFLSEPCIGLRTRYYLRRFWPSSKRCLTPLHAFFNFAVQRLHWGSLTMQHGSYRSMFLIRVFSAFSCILSCSYLFLSPYTYFLLLPYLYLYDISVTLTVFRFSFGKCCLCGPRLNCIL